MPQMLHIGFVRQLDALHFRPVVALPRIRSRRHAVLQDLLVVVDVVEQQVEGGDPLDHAALDMRATLRPTSTRGITSNGRMRSIAFSSE